MTLKEVTVKTAADGKPVDRSVKNVALTDQEILALLKTFDLPFDLQQELEHALDEHPDTVFEL
jgi:ABC-type enterochelin transport system substrate-binding protein